jgi:hypothetical protein
MSKAWSQRPARTRRSCRTCRPSCAAAAWSGGPAVHDLGQEVALDAVQAAVDRRIGVALGGDDAAVLDADQHAAAGAAEAAGALSQRAAWISTPRPRPGRGDDRPARRSRVDRPARPRRRRRLAGRLEARPAAAGPAALTGGRRAFPGRRCLRRRFYNDKGPGHDGGCGPHQVTSRAEPDRPLRRDRVASLVPRRRQQATGLAYWMSRPMCDGSRLSRTCARWHTPQAMLNRDFKESAEWLHAKGADCLVAGGCALAAHGHPRDTGFKATSARVAAPRIWPTSRRWIRRRVGTHKATPARRGG